MKKDVLSATIATVYLVTYTILFHTGAPLPFIWTMFILSPFVVLWMVYSILKKGVYTGKELGENEEWGYSDKGREELGTW